MSSKSEKDRAKQIQERCQNILMQMLKDEDNKYCVDCDAKGPRWASWNLGIFLCIRCAGIHRNLGVHISKVKSVNLDSWTPEQVVSLQQMGNSRARAVYEANLPDSFRRPQNDSSLEAFIRAKYETKKYIAKEWVPPSPPKVNWDKEIDEEMERQKRKKKSTTVSTVGPLPPPTSGDKKYNKSDVIPSIPKPKASVSPKLGRSPATQPDPAPSKPSNGAADLLGLDTSKTEKDDIFSSFFSAPQEAKVTPEVKAEPAKPDLKLEEENFFKQAAPSEKEKSKLTKDSILALYSQTPATNLSSNQFNNQQQGFYNAPFQATFNSQNANQNGMPNFSQFSANQPSNQFAGQTNNQFGGQPNNQFAVNQPSNQFAVSQPSNQFATTQPSNQFAVSQPSNQFATTQPSNQFAASQPSNQFAASQQNNQFAVSQPNNQFQQFPNAQSFSNAFQNQSIPNQSMSNQLFNVGQPPAPQNQLNQQFGNLNLGQFPNTFAQPNVNVASNLTWQ